MLELRSLLVVTLSVLYLCILINGMSDTYGQNPQHEFGDVFGQRVTPLIPFWKVEGDAFASEDFVRVVPDRQSKRGGIWNTQANRFTNWEVTYKFRVHGVSILGADGLAFWYVQEPTTGGSYFGHTDKFKGLGVLLDTYDNDNSGIHPLLVVAVGDGKRKMDHEHHHLDEGEEPKKQDMELGNCGFQIRNFERPSMVKIRYLANTLTVEIAATDDDQSVFKSCVEAHNVHLPAGYFFGFTAATGQLADNHDLYGVSVKNLDANSQSFDSQRVFSFYDKYSIAETLSKLQFDLDKTMRVINKGGPSTSSTSSSGKLDLPTEVYENLHRVEDIGNDVQNAVDTLKKLSERMEGIESKLASGAAGGGSSGLRHSNEMAFSSLKTDIQNLENSIKSVYIKMQSVEETVKNTLTGSGGNSDNTQQQQQRQQQQLRDDPTQFVKNNFINTAQRGITNQSSDWVSILLTTILWFVVAVVVLALGVVIFFFARKRSTKSKKHF